jgi:hypothetical protein
VAALAPIAVVAARAADAGASSQPIVASAIEERIEREGARSTLQSLYANPVAWQSALRHMSTGAPRWFRIAEALRAASDSGASSQLDAAVAEALGSNPAFILSHATGSFSPSRICKAPDIDDARFDDFSSALAELDRRVAAVETVSEAELGKVRDDCLASLRRSEAGLRRFFDRE